MAKKKKYISTTNTCPAVKQGDETVMFHELQPWHGKLFSGKGENGFNETLDTNISPTVNKLKSSWTELKTKLPQGWQAESSPESPDPNIIGTLWGDLKTAVWVRQNGKCTLLLSSGTPQKQGAQTFAAGPFPFLFVLALMQIKVIITWIGMCLP